MNAKNATPHIVFTGGGSLGPVTPLIAVARAVQALSPNAQVSWIGTHAGPERRLVAEAGFAFTAISSGKLRRYFSWQNFSDALRIIAGFFQSLVLLRKLRASVVVTAGGFVAVQVCWAAKVLRIPVHVHQQDVLAGLANKLSLPTAKTVSVALESSLRDFASKKPVWTGNPIRPEVFTGSREHAASAFGLEPGVPTVLVLGGGTGAAGLNDLLRGALPAITATAQVIHSAGTGKADASVTNPRYHQYELITKDLPDAFAAADLVVTRAGMGTLTELASLGKPCIIVPMPRSHQEDNARAFANAATVLDQRSATPESFATAVLGLLRDRAAREASAAKMRCMNLDGAAQAIAKVVLGAAR